jgi:transcriptional regulator with XRE-family HTH domain
MANGLPEQERLRRRLRAVRIMVGITLTELADRLDPTWKLSERTLRKLENNEAPITERALRPIAEALDWPYAWFLTEDPAAPWRRGVENQELAVEFERRLAALEATLRQAEEASEPDAPRRRAPRSRAGSARPSEQ